MIAARRLSAVLLLALGSLLVAPTLASAGTYALQWKLSTTGVWPPALIDGKVVLKKGDTLTAYHLGNGRQVWQRQIGSLRYGAGVLSAGGRYVYVLGSSHLYLLNPTDGKLVKKKRLKNPNSVHYYSGSVYITSSVGVERYDHTVSKVLSRAAGFTGEIRGADGNYVAIYVHKPTADPKVSPKRLVVVDLKKRKQAYEFKLLPTGWHRVVKVGRGRVVFIDYSQRTSAGKNSRELYYTEADYVRGKKLKDAALSKKFPTTYSAAASDTFWAATDKSGIVFLGNHGNPGAPSTLMAYDPVHDKILWNRNGAVISAGLLLHKGMLWTGVNAVNGGASAVAYSPDDGDILFRHKLDAPVTGTPVAAGERVLLRTRGAVYCFKAVVGTAAVTAAPPTAKSTPLPTRAKPGWRLYRDKVAGYLMQTPTTWQFDRRRMTKMGGMRMSIPFVRTTMIKGRSVFLGSVHILTWEASGRTVSQLWQNVYAQQRRAHPDLRVLKVHQVQSVGGSGMPGVKATYTYRDKGYAVQLRSLCVVSHGVAFEVRGWAGPTHPRAIWSEIEAIMKAFRPHRM
jgi:PQQ-like domain